MRIAIDAGHFPNTPGKRCPDDSMREYHFNSTTARYAIDMLLKNYEDIEILETFEDSRDVPLPERTDRANKWGADLFVSIHANAAGNGWSAAEGIETFVYTSWPAPAVALANSVQRHLIRMTGRQDRGVKASNFHVLRETKMTSILVECGFMTNRQEAELLKSDGYRRKCATAIVAGIAETYGPKRKPVAPEPQLPTIQKRIGVIVDGKEVGGGYLIEGTSYAPVRIVAEQVGASVGWDGEVVHIRRRSGP